MNQSRVARLTEHARAQGWQAVVLVPGPDLYYLTGLDMHLSERPALIFFPAYGEPFALAPGFEAERVRQGAGIGKVYAWGDEEGPAPPSPMPA